ncbi:aldose 1-epimerase [Alkalicoccobacillus murimartini]|uniref:Aldose 1-epimerase n=1 Tax=Alkalicoccobacillus murimartini TaxID=171685 RepID=A0ABT9YDS6_9BACI|nr:aldose 1-epimerase [Alkalicoccobacillus murimartini]MDQ0205998.1 aldose 1-epimerase [Alkalicoccobacillus murimartini]
MSTYVREGSFQGIPTVEAGNDVLDLIIVPEWGSNLISIKTKNPQVDILRTPTDIAEYERAPVQFGVPILFPPNRISDGTFTFENRNYVFDLTEPEKQNHIHGFVYSKPWKIKSMDATEDQVRIVTSIHSEDHPDILRQFPHFFSIEMVFILKGGMIYKDAIITNHSDQTFPWGIGYHTTFQFPEETSRFSLQSTNQWVLNDRLLPTGEWMETPYKGLQEGISLKEIELDDAFLTDQSASTNQTVITRSDQPLRVSYRADSQFKHWVVYNADAKQGYVCPEPYTWITNAPNLELSDEITGIQVLKPGESTTAKTEIEITNV